MAHRTFFKWDLPSRYDAAEEAAKADAAQERDVYTHVTLRDGQRCRVCGRRSNPHAVGVLYKAHHHHIAYRSAGGGTTVENVCLLCPDCHNAEHMHRLAIEGNAERAPWLTLSRRDAEGRWYVWRQEVGIRRYVERD